MYRPMLVLSLLFGGVANLAVAENLADSGWNLVGVELAAAQSQAESFEGIFLRGQEPERFDPLNADRPDFTESPRTVGRRRLQLEAGWLYSHDTVGGKDHDSHVLPELLLRFGLTERIELRFAWEGYASHEETDLTSNATVSRRGGTDPWFGCKLQVTKQQCFRPESALIVAVSAPVGARVWTSDRVDTAIDYIYGWDLTDRLSVAASTGAWWTEQDEDQFSVIHQSAVLGYGLTERLGTYLEWFGLIYHGSRIERPEHYLSGGLTFLVTENLQFDWRLGVGLTEASEDLFTGVGFAVRW